MMGLFITVAAIAVLGGLLYGITRICVARQPRAPYFKEPLQQGWLRVVAHDEVGGSDLTRVVGDYATFEEAHAEAARLRSESELSAGQKGVPTKFFIYDHTESLVGDWTGRRTL